MFWLGVAVVVALFLLWMWRLDRNRRGTVRNLGWGGRNAGTPGLTGAKPATNAASELSRHAFEIESDLTAPRTERRSPRPDELPRRRRFWQRGRGRSSEDR